MSLLHRRSGNDRPWEVTPRSHRRDCAWRDHVRGTRIEPMEQPGFLARLFGR